MLAPRGNVKFDYQGAAVLVTGGTSGLGASIASAYRDAGADVTLTGTRTSASDYEADLSGCGYRQLNVENPENIDAVAASLPRLDILVNNAGVLFHPMGIDEMDPDVFERALTIHLSSAHRMAVRCREMLAESALPGGASVIGMGSLGSLFGLEVIPAYGTAKTGLLGLTRALAVAWGKQSIRVNTIIVGTTWTPMTTPVLADPDFSREHLARTPLGRHGMPDDISGVVLFLTSEAGAWITGQSIAVDGGYTISG